MKTRGLMKPTPKIEKKRASSQGQKMVAPLKLKLMTFVDPEVRRGQSGENMPYCCQKSKHPPKYKRKSSSNQEGRRREKHMIPTAANRSMLPSVRLKRRMVPYWKHIQLILQL
ncbi:uncharacterized protein LOC119579478 [Penaeus monodon]|uniref:uncharacterized protein LOC119579478 n=1 Tax=Penaeus monodon TaxID=6687 RepID=UPI0018A78E18|nr:uncharacterized protein LOC119579478 [Penaeus monodon]XP_037783246.1 uncharacterized protein LOC119579478 [Penaeus monodon]